MSRSVMFANAIWFIKYSIDATSPVSPIRVTSTFPSQSQLSCPSRRVKLVHAWYGHWPGTEFHGYSGGGENGSGGGVAWYATGISMIVRNPLRRVFMLAKKTAEPGPVTVPL